MGARRSPEERFWAKVDRSGGPEACWPWTAASLPLGYGVFAPGASHAEPKTERAHRYSWRLANGPIPSGMFVCHHCDNPPCVNPAHLFAAPPADNTRDMVAKGRHPLVGFTVVPARGSKHGAAKLTEPDVLAIRRMRAEGWEQVFLAGAFGVTSSAISQITRRARWRHI